MGAPGRQGRCTPFGKGASRGSAWGCSAMHSGACPCHIGRPGVSSSSTPGLLLAAQHHFGGGGGGPTPPAHPPLDPPRPLKGLGQIFFRTFGRSKIFSGTFGANQFRLNICLGASKTSSPPGATPPPPPARGLVPANPPPPSLLRSPAQPPSRSVQSHQRVPEGKEEVAQRATARRGRGAATADGLPPAVERRVGHVT